MFTGIIEEIGKVVHNHKGVLLIETGLGGLKPGDSIAIDGACLTATHVHKAGSRHSLEFELSLETISRTCLGYLKDGERVNLERPLTLNKLVGGHLITGHVDGAVLILKKTDLAGGHARARFELPKSLRPFVATKGSVSVDGVSLTVTKAGSFYFETVLIPYTMKNSTLGHKAQGDLVNLEVDLIARYLQTLSEAR